ncbi:MAG: hypothetical protein B7Z80_25180 [Rhodospirillales bacterium 20-64-7]|nr:MAG: hypothetical protein B7Z80_25180 [Rhodospirillales bacterium 20-64-7]
MQARRRSILGLAAAPIALSAIDAAARAAPRRAPTPVAPPPVVETHRGKVRGAVEDGIKVFKGIPYAAAERFHAPRPAGGWSGVRDALAFGPTCPQLTRPTPPASRPAEATDDCLTLNVWTPAIRDHGKRAVMVWLHGGGFSAGSASRSVLDGTRLCQRGNVVVVTVNHRLNVFGFLYLAHLGGAAFAESGNAGMLDIVAALHWVHENIASFGGDPGNVTIFGQSGGGAKVSTLMAMPQARGLFHKAIVQSGSHLEGLTPEEATRYAATYLAALDMKASDVPRLSRLPVAALLAGLGKVMQAPGPKPNFSPVVDGIVLPKGPWQPDAPPVSAAVPMLIGSTATETTNLIGAAHPEDFALTDTALPNRLIPWLPARDVNRVIAGFRELMPGAAAADLFFAITTDRRVRQQAWAQAERKAVQGGATQGAAPVWLYAMLGTGPAPQLIADQMSAAWIAFARTGKPDTTGLPPWPPFTLAQRATMVFDTTPRIVNDYRGQERAMLASLPLYRVLR